MAVQFDTAQDPADYVQFFQDNDYPGIPAIGPSSMVRDYSVATQSTKLGIAPDGRIVFRDGYGSASPSEWRSRFDTLKNS